MATHAERRRVARLPVPAQLSGRGIGELQVRLLDLSPQGARIEHTLALPARGLFFLVLPQGLGDTSLQGEVIWSHITEYRLGPKGKSEVCSQSGLRFLMLTGEQEAQLAEALRLLKAASEG